VARRGAEVKVQPVEGKANAELIALVADWFDGPTGGLSAAQDRP